MFYLFLKMWAFLLGFAVLGGAVTYWMVRGQPRAADEEMLAELAAARTRQKEAEADRDRMRARSLETDRALSDARLRLEAASAREADLRSQTERLAEDMMALRAEGDGAAAAAHAQELERALADAREARAQADRLETEVREMADLRARLESLHAEGEQAADREAALMAERDALGAHVEALAAAALAAAPEPGAIAADFEGDASQLRLRVRQLEEAFETAQTMGAQAASAAAQLASAEDEAARLREQAERLEAQRDAAEEDAAALRGRVDALEVGLDAQGDGVSADHAGDAAALRAQMRRLEVQLEAAEDDAAAMRHRLAEAQEAEDVAPMPALTAIGVAAAFDDDAAALRRRARVAEHALETAEDDAAALRSQLVALETRLEEAVDAAEANGELDIAEEGAVDFDALPTFLDEPVLGAPDDLQKIKGVGPKLEQTLHDLGVFYYRQIGSWTDAQVAEVDSQLAFRGRIDRDDWRGQARVLGAGGTTDFPRLREETQHQAHS